LEQVEDILRRLNEYRKKSVPGSEDIDITVNSYSLKAGKQGKESIVSVEVDLSLTPKTQTGKAADEKSSSV